ncbi:MAG: hypothetical protein PHT54_03455 [Candidatus Nanoarchaeia archaeon]|nr:hypothetical protein [Candidatus Nanoarchaeia archaeon]
MKYKIRIEIILPKTDGTEYERTETIYEQVVEDLVVKDVISAVNFEKNPNWVK